MSIELTSQIYANYLEKVSQVIKENKEYVTSLDSVTGDGDHWVNINMGFENILKEIENLKTMPIYQVFKKMGMVMMSKIGGSSGILYGGAYIAASKALDGKESLNSEDICTMLKVMVEDMMNRGKAEPGFKTMIDSLYPAAKKYEECLAQGKEDKETLQSVKKAAIDGAQSTMNMESVKGRASYREDKGVGHLDPGAITMSYQIESLCDTLIEKI